MLTSKPTPKHRGRQKPKHTVFDCPLCARKLRMKPSGILFCGEASCGWMEDGAQIARL